LTLLVGVLGFNDATANDGFFRNGVCVIYAILTSAMVLIVTVKF
jgi:hypothetical protein